MDHFSPNQQEYIVVCVSTIRLSIVIRPEYSRLLLARPTKTSQTVLYSLSQLVPRPPSLWWIRSALGEAVLLTVLACPQVRLQLPMYASLQFHIIAPLTTLQYGSGTARVVPTKDHNLHFSNDSDIWTFPVPTTGTQGVSEPHMTYQYGNEVFIPDKVS